MTPLESINDQQLLDLCLELQSLREFDMEGLSGELITLHCMNEYYNETKSLDFTNEDLVDKISNLASEYELSRLVKEGYLDVVFDEQGVSYTATNKAREEANETN